jgi:hypothetical protein
MRIYHKNFFPLNIDLKHVGDFDQSSDISIYDSKFELRSFDKTVIDEIEKIKIEIEIPIKLMIQINIKENQKIELIRFNFAGIDVMKDRLITCIDHRIGQPKSLEQFDNLPAENDRLCWTQSGCLSVNLFHHNPLSWHLYLGNKIKF